MAPASRDGRRGLSLGAKTTLLVASIMLVALAGAAALSLHYEERALRSAIGKGIDGQAHLAAHGIAAFVQEALRDAAGIASALPVEDLAAGRVAIVQEHLARMLALFPAFDNGLFVLDADARFVIDFPPHPDIKGQSLAFRDYYQRTISTGQGVVGAPYRSKRTGRPVLTFTAPLRDRAGRLVAILCCSIDLLADRALRGYQRQRYGDSGYLFVFDSQRLLALHPEEERLLTRIPEGRNRMVEAALRGYEGVDDTVNSVGVPMLIAVRAIPGTDWRVAVQVPTAEALRPLADARLRVVATAAAAMLLSVLLGFLAVRKVSRPLASLERAASEIDSGLALARAGGVPPAVSGALAALGRIRAHDEIGRLARSFQTLATNTEGALASLRRAAADWERTFDAVGEALILLDREGAVVRLNTAAERWLGCTSQAARGRSAEEVVFDATPPSQPLPEVARMGPRRLRWSQEMEKPHGTFDFTLAPVLEDGSPVGAILVMGDATERQRREQETLRADRLASLGVLAGGIAHDFNNLLAAILGNLSLARHEARELASLDEVLDDAEQAALRAKELTLQLLTFSRGGEPIRKRVTLEQLVRATAGFVLRGSKVACEYRLPADLWPLDADAGQLSQVIHNLVLNAIQSMPGGGIVRIGAENVEAGPGPGRRVRLWVQDQGMGIAPELRQRIFDPYFTTKASGTGLGLATTHSIVTRHGGTIEVESEPGKGTTFRIELPAAEGPTADAAPTPAPLPGGRGRILVVDDDQLVLRTACRMLEQLGYQSAQARSGEEALAQHARALREGRPFDAAILDLTMPGSAGGAEVLRQLQAAEPGIRAIVSSGYSNDPVMSDYRAHGFADVVAKPYRLEELGGALARLLPQAPRASGSGS